MLADQPKFTYLSPVRHWMTSREIAKTNCFIATMISITTVIQIHIQIQYRRTLSFQIRTGLLISDFGPWRHEERDTVLKSLC